VKDLRFQQRVLRGGNPIGSGGLAAVMLDDDDPLWEQHS
jgi:hypothetical protein